MFADLHFHASLRATLRETPPAIASPSLGPIADATFNRTGGSWEECHRAGGRDDRVIVLHALEGGHALGGSVAALDAFAARGVVFVTLTHFFDKGLASAGNALPFFPDAGSNWPNAGRTDLRRDVIVRIEELGILLDATHASPTPPRRQRIERGGRAARFGHTRAAARRIATAVE